MADKELSPMEEMRLRIVNDAMNIHNLYGSFLLLDMAEKIAADCAYRFVKAVNMLKEHTIPESIVHDAETNLHMIVEKLETWGKR